MSNPILADSALPPLALYIHIPWCVRKCPYCDFNSHKKPEQLPVEEYCSALIRDLKTESAFAFNRKISSIFFGGGTPSLFPPKAIGEIIDATQKHIGIETHAEITLETNPGTTEYFDFAELKKTGVNRISLGVQSFQNEQLKALGRIHDQSQIYTAYEKARKAGIDNINIDLMHGLPGQTPELAIQDIECAVALAPEHLSWYQLTIEPNTEFYSRPPQLPEEDYLVDIQEAGHSKLSDANYVQYEISAYSRKGYQSQHNINYWQFGDYIGVGAGAHGKLTFRHPDQIIRTQKTRLPKDYLGKETNNLSIKSQIETNQLPLEFMMNGLRLVNGVPISYWQSRAHGNLSELETLIQPLINKGLLEFHTNSGDVVNIRATELGRHYLNTVLQEFIAD
ncbi:radical SAM family heme chaperone HemW [Teredinibacter sp. KSP-S5-2]|uniref:radical SAM family heme chaperone HemW n=1 Tax=Teredinibacter sp. KSP-S5-2 TaxID=3034506 RepID=UPI002934ACDB|nr:radical SAM family heme chaperone HemW [Teredinibacter sp. KSP-S5-2]WNO09341.1 radical SAM family heme chaperone HemW [Teredinibacter sp. KSP-S5-2]